MRRVLLIATFVFTGVASAQAATITGELIDLNFTNFIPGSVHSIEILLKSDTPYGIQGVGFNVISAGTGKVSFPGGSTNTIEGPGIAADGYGFVKPSGTDASNYANYLGQPPPSTFPLSDGDLDAIGGSMAAAPGSVDSDPGDGAVFGASGGFELLATEKWTFNAGDALELYLVGPQYFTDTSGNNVAAYDTVMTSGTFFMPEPASLVLLGLGGLGLAAFARRRRG